jgi:hypothetical protein
VAHPFMMRFATRLNRVPVGIAWIGACAGAELLGMALAAGAFGIGALLDAQPGLSAPAARWLTYALAVAAGGGEGLALGLLQGMVLKRRLPFLDLRHFIAAMVAIGLVGWAVGMLPATMFAVEDSADTSLVPLESDATLTILVAASFGAAGGVVIGIVQVLVLRPAAVGGFAAWILLNGLGWAAAFVVIFVGASAPPEGTSLAALLAAGAVTGVAAGGVLGLATLPALSRLVPKSHVGQRRNLSPRGACQ